METKKIKVRIALVIDNTGDWSAAGWHSADKDLQTCFDVCLDGLAENEIEKKWIVEAEIEIPELSQQTIEGTATKQTED